MTVSGEVSSRREGPAPSELCPWGMTVLPPLRKRRNPCHPEIHTVTQPRPGAPEEEACGREGPVHSELCRVPVVPEVSALLPEAPTPVRTVTGCHCPLYAYTGPPWVPSSAPGGHPCTDRCAAQLRHSHRADRRRLARGGGQRAGGLVEHLPTLPTYSCPRSCPLDTKGVKTGRRPILCDQRLSLIPGCPWTLLVPIHL